jgi:hypothetical protein
MPSIHRATSKPRGQRPREVLQHCTAVTLAAQEQPKIQMRIDAADVAECIMILLLNLLMIMMRTLTPQPMLMVHRIWTTGSRYGRLQLKNNSV